MYMPAFACVTSHDNAPTSTVRLGIWWGNLALISPLLFKVRNIGDLHDFMHC